MVLGTAGFVAGFFEGMVAFGVGLTDGVADGEAVPDLDALAEALTAELDLLDPPAN
ncbi:hypothetical protein R6L23_15535 [Streptomyces sp. SR27]|uniref:hypothetical protein n=1 Tax=Streptomyces sp. SR27 TaxID=3076630 RepID=UPI00295B23F7|nr:hypothetical protein [Streptomyces sp. SR27]MDV9189608.1 hypothetical protein [Streptomyces sp. SR27]